MQGLLLGVVAVTDWLWKHIGLLWILCSRQGCFGCYVADIQGLLWVLCGRHTRVTVGIIWQIYRGYCGFHVEEAYRYFGYYVADTQVLLWVLYDRHTRVAVGFMWKRHTGVTVGIMWQTYKGYSGYYMADIHGWLLWLLCGITSAEKKGLL